MRARNDFSEAGVAGLFGFGNWLLHFQKSTNLTAPWEDYEPT
jgi:hypothetical protein